MTPEADTLAAFLTVLVASLTQIGIPGVFLYAWYYERKQHDATMKSYLRDLRRAAGLTRPEDVLMTDPLPPGAGD